MSNERLPIVNWTKNYFIAAVDRIRNEYPQVSFYPTHVEEVEKWATIILKDHPEADIETVMLGVWLHDIGNLIGNKKVDHAVRSERIARLILYKTGTPIKKINAVAHCVRAHRNKDVEPQTIEAKILAASDSASHMTGEAYLVYAGRNNIEGSFGKLERDFRDIGLVPGLQEKLTPLYEAWKNLLSVYPKLD